MCVCVCVCIKSHIFFIQSSVNEYIDYFHILAIVNNAAFNMGAGVGISSRSDFISFGYEYIPSVELLNHTVVLVLIF